MAWDPVNNFHFRSQWVPAGGFIDDCKHVLAPAAVCVLCSYTSTNPTCTCSKSTMETLEQRKKYVPS